MSDTVKVTGHCESTFQEMRFTINGGGPLGMEVIVQSKLDGFYVKFWHPFNHEWVTLRDDVLIHHGNTIHGLT